jgi:hypothetical protein
MGVERSWCSLEVGLMYSDLLLYAIKFYDFFQQDLGPSK